MENTLKNYLLATDMFIDNDFLDEYCRLIIANLSTKRAKFKTQSHHIIPKSYFKIIREEVNNNKENLVNLQYSDHILAHYFLSLCCSNKELQYYMESALTFMVDCIDFDTTCLSEYTSCYEDLCRQRSERQKGIPQGPITEERRNKLLEYYKTHKGASYGTRLSDEDKQKISIATKEGMAKWRAGLTDEEYQARCDNISKKLTGIVRSEETKRKISDGRRGKDNPMYGKAHPSRKKVYCVELNKIFDCVQSAAKETGVADSNICACLKGRAKTSAGYHWQYYEEEI